MNDEPNNDAGTRLLQLIALEEAERQRIAHELHSEIGQDLTAALLGLQFFAEDGVPAEEIPELIGSVRRALERVRALSLRLRPPLLDEIGLEAALRSSLQPLAEAGGISFELSTHALPDPLPAGSGISVFRALQALALQAPAAACLRIELRGVDGALQLRAQASCGADAALEAFRRRLLGSGALAAPVDEQAPFDAIAEAADWFTFRPALPAATTA